MSESYVNPVDRALRVGGDVGASSLPASSSRPGAASGSGWPRRSGGSGSRSPRRPSRRWPRTSPTSTSRRPAPRNRRRATTSWRTCACSEPPLRPRGASSTGARPPPTSPTTATSSRCGRGWRSSSGGSSRVLKVLRDFALAHRDLPALAYTHFQPAQPTTVGKRATLWASDLLMDLEEARARAPGPAVPRRQGRHGDAGVVPAALRRRLEARRRAGPRARRARRLRAAPDGLGPDVLAQAGRPRRPRPLRPRPVGAQARHGPAPAPARGRARGAVRGVAGRLLRDAVQAQPHARRKGLLAGAPRHRALARHGDDGGDPVARAHARRLGQQAHRRAGGVPRGRRDPDPSRERSLRTRRPRRRRAAAAWRPRRLFSRRRTS